MNGKQKAVCGALVLLALAAGGLRSGAPNGGPFVVKYPNGDPAAKGVLARLDPDLKPMRETRLRVIEEDLTIDYTVEPLPILNNKDVSLPPLVEVTAAYTIENPTSEDIAVDFGFPILRGIYIPPMSMMPAPDVIVTLTDKKTATLPPPANRPDDYLGRLQHTVISNSAIYGIIRERARSTIEESIARDSDLMDLVQAIKNSSNEKERQTHRAALATYLVDKQNWSTRDAALMVEYASLDFGQPTRIRPRDRGMFFLGPFADQELAALLQKNLGPLAAIGEQKTTQFFAHLASRFQPDEAAAYEKIFKAWGGDVRERAVDMASGDVRPREIEVDRSKLGQHTPFSGISDPTVYARVNYFDENAKITPSERASCRAVLKNLPVIFTFAPMNLLHYQAKFPANETRVLTVRYKQYAFKDTRTPRSYQIAYVVHPASLWDDFGPINLKIIAPEDVKVRATVPCSVSSSTHRQIRIYRDGKWVNGNVPYSIRETVLRNKQGELLVAVDGAGWDRLVRLDPRTLAEKAEASKQVQQPQ